MQNFKLFDLCFSAQLKEAILNGVSLEDDKREQFNKIEQVCLEHLQWTFTNYLLTLVFKSRSQFESEIC